MVTEENVETQRNPDLWAAISEYHAELEAADNEEAKADSISLGLVTQARGRRKRAEEELKPKIRKLVEDLGPYTKDELGWEARIEERVTISYDPDGFRAVAPELAQACIEETVNATKVGGLLKGKLVTAEQLEPATKRKVTKAFILR
ncbi:MAG: hypothetical protein SVK08_00750 [Halobacteriota archaeon]|nr:hypothetical protein [Halobacteriota archaeon]